MSILSNFNKHDPDVIAYISPHNINNIDLRKPVVIAWWSAAFSGFGHLILGHYGIGFILLIHEFIINNLSGLNRALFYSFTGQFEAAKESMNLWWTLSYAPPYLFGIWDSYRRTIQQNEDYIIARNNGVKVISRSISTTGLNRLDLKNPFVAICWSLIAPGAGHFYINRILIALIVPWLVIAFYFANLLPAVHLTFMGDFDAAKTILDPQWLLFLPSMYGFFEYDAYVHTLEYNNLYKIQQKNILQTNYQNKKFQMPL